MAAYVKWLREDERFSDVLVQLSPARNGHAFPKLKLRYKPSLERASAYLNKVVAAGLDGSDAGALASCCAAGSFVGSCAAGFGVTGSYVRAFSSGKIWKPLDIGFKINVHAALDLGRNAFCVRVVVRNTFRAVVCVTSFFFECPFDVEVAKAQGILASISLVINRGFSLCVIESDALNVVQLCKGIVSSKGEINNLILNLSTNFLSAGFLVLGGFLNWFSRRSEEEESCSNKHEEAMLWVVVVIYINKVEEVMGMKMMEIYSYKGEVVMEMVAAETCKCTEVEVIGVEGVGTCRCKVGAVMVKVVGEICRYREVVGTLDVGRMRR
ncbi:hypothetical protein ACOSQ3_017424 [Xanthoceras sorbifolium]